LRTAMACTLRLAVETARFGQPEVALGLIPGDGGTQRVPRLVSKGRALHLILSGEIISAAEAYRIGLVNEIVPAANLIARADEILTRIAGNAPIAVKFALEATNKGMETSQSEGCCSKLPTSASAPPPRTRKRAHPPSSKSASRNSRGAEQRLRRQPRKQPCRTTIFSLA
jgi:enoyl-CoA hydratase/carnithine racemase